MALINQQFETDLIYREVYLRDATPRSSFSINWDVYSACSTYCYLLILSGKVS